MNEKVLIIPTDKIRDKFKEHLLIENNNRIIFSWKYWIWKTYFLNDFFENNNDYETFHIYPINYQINSNDDIINFLKYDILVELINKNQDIFKDVEITSFLDYSILTYLFLSDKNNVLDVLKTWFEYIQKLGHQMPDLIKISEKFFTFKDKLSEWEKWIIDEFLNKIKESNISETDFLSWLIKEKINELKWNKQSVLVLDDLDRIDPEHIFRLLNVFWAHFDWRNKEISNKFWFDKIILVCDYNNIKSLFHHKYWKEADFNWYIDKFFSIEKFDFNNSLIIESFIGKVIESFKVNNLNLSTMIKDNRNYYNIFLSSFLKQNILLEWKNKLNLRELLKPINFNISSLNWISEYGELYVIKIFTDTLITILWDKNHLIEVLNKIKEKNIEKKYKTDILGENKFNKIYGFFIYHIYRELSIEDDNQDFSNINYKNKNFSLNHQNQNIENIDENQIYELFYEILIDHIINN